LLTIRNKILELQIAQQVSSSSTPPGRLPTRPEPNPEEHCNVIVLRSVKQLEGPMYARVKVESEKGYDGGIPILPSENESPMENENEKSKDPTHPFPKPYSSLCHSHKNLLRLSLILSLLSFLMCLRISC